MSSSTDTGTPYFSPILTRLYVYKFLFAKQNISSTSIDLVIISVPYTFLVIPISKSLTIHFLVILSSSACTMNFNHTFLVNISPNTFTMYCKMEEGRWTKNVWLIYIFGHSSLLYFHHALQPFTIQQVLPSD